MEAALPNRGNQTPAAANPPGAIPSTQGRRLRRRGQQRGDGSAAQPRRPTAGVPFSPIAPFVFYWSASLVVFHFGPFALPLLHPATYLYLAVYLALFLWAYRSGYRARSPAAPAPLPSERSLFQWMFLIGGAWVLGLALLIVDKLRSGVTLTTVLTDTERVRDEYGTTWLSTLAAPFALQTITVVALGFWLCRKGFRQSRAAVGVLTVGMALWMVLALQGMSKGAFLNCLLWLVLFVFLVRGASVREFVRGRNYRWVRLGGLAATILALVYFIFNVSYRANEGYLRSIVGPNSNLRYELPIPFLPERERMGATLALHYFVDAFPAVESYVTDSPLFKFDPEILAAWYLRQAGRLYPPAEAAYNDAFEAYAADRLSRNLMEFAWCSIIGDGVYMFGTVGNLVVVALAGYGFGRVVRRFVWSSSLLDLFWVLLFYYLFSHAFMGFVVDGAMSVALATTPLVFWLNQRAPDAPRPRTVDPD